MVKVGWGLQTLYRVKWFALLFLKEKGSLFIKDVIFG